MEDSSRTRTRVRIESPLFVCRVRLTAGSELAANLLPNAYPALRASDRGYLQRGLLDHVRLLDWTGRQIRRDKAGAIPSTLAPILERLQLDADQWVDTVTRMRRLLRSALGRSEKIDKEAQSHGPSVDQGRTLCPRPLWLVGEPLPCTSMSATKSPSLPDQPQEVAWPHVPSNGGGVHPAPAV